MGWAGASDDAPSDTHPRWGVGDALIGFALGFVAQTVSIVILVARTGREADTLDDLPLAAVALLQVPLWIGLLGWPLVASLRKGRGPVADFGLRARPADLPVGFGLGVLTQVLLVPLLYVPIFWVFDSLGSDDVSAEARELTDRASGAGVLVLILVVVVGAPIAEEVFYRGLLQRSLARRLGTGWAVALTSVVFGLAHFQVVQFPALVLFGLLAGVLAARTGRLGPAILAHAGFNAWTVFALLALDPTT